MTIRLKKHDYISPTAISVAYLRTFTNIPFSREIYQAMKQNLSKISLNALELHYESRPIPFFEARYKLINYLVKQSRLKNILDVAAGYIPRGLVLTKDPAVSCVEFDLPTVTREKRKIVNTILKTRKERRPNLHLISGNALDFKALNTACARLQPGPIAIVNEGLLRYLTRSEQKKLASNIHAILVSRGGIWITTDIHLRDRLLGDKAGLRRTRYFARLTKTTIEKNLFADKTEAKQFFTDAGFSIRQYRVTTIIPKLSCPKRLGLTKATVRASLKNRLAFVLTAK
ncbi:MAG: hypothetical protein WC863_03485 [Patescibacteria group bacterium]